MYQKTVVFSIPLTANRLLMHLLQSGESILIPAQLVIFGNTQNEALSIYGILMGMSLPLILFPSAITNSMAVMLLPEVSGAQADGDNARIVTYFEPLPANLYGNGIFKHRTFLILRC